MCLALVAIKSWVFFVLYTRPLNCCQKKKHGVRLNFPSQAQSKKKILKHCQFFKLGNKITGTIFSNGFYHII